MKARRRGERIRTKVAPKRKKKPVVPLRSSETSVAQRLDAERETVFKAMAIIDVVRSASASLDVERDPEMVVYALKAAYDLLDETAGELEVIAKEGAK